MARLAQQRDNGIYHPVTMIIVTFRLACRLAYPNGHAIYTMYVIYDPYLNMFAYISFGKFSIYGYMYYQPLF